MATITKPMALDESFNTTESTSRNQADVLVGIEQAIVRGFGQVANAVSYDNTDSGLTADNVQDAIDEVDDTVDGLVDDVAEISSDIESTQTASGNPLTLTDCAPINAESLVVELEPKQDLHGYDNPWVGGAGKNKVDVTPFTVQAGGANTFFIADPTVVAGKTYTFSCNQNNSMTSNERNTLIVVDNGTSIYESPKTNYHLESGRHSITFTASADGTVSLRMWTHTLSTDTLYNDFQFEEGSTATTFAPYTNICPITGYTQTSVETLTDIQSYYDIQTIVRSGKAQEVFNIGDEIPVKYTATNGTQYDMPFRVVAFQNVELQDGTTKQGMFLQSKYATLEGVQFDAPEPDNTLGSGGAKDDNVASYGYNRWSESGIRAWLNSDATANNWWGSTFERGGQTVSRRAADVAPTQSASVNGFLRGLPSSFVDVLGKVKMQTSCNTATDSGVTDTTYDKIFLASLEQMYTTPQASGVEGEYFEYWKEALGLNSPSSWHPSTYEAYKTYALENHNSAQNVRLRSAYRGYSYSTWYVYSGGSIHSYTANNALRSAPVCVIC